MVDFVLALRAAPFAEVVAAYVVPRPAAEAAQPPLSMRLYAALDRALLAEAPEALRPRPLEGIVPLALRPGGLEAAPEGARLADALLAELAENELDVVVALETGPLVAQGTPARHGLWSAEAPAEGDAFAPGFWEVLQGQEVTPATLWQVNGQRTPLYHAVTRTRPFSAHRNQEVYGREVAAALLHRLHALYAGGPLAPAPAPTVAAATPLDDAFGPLVQLVARNTREALRRLFKHDQWSIAYTFGEPGAWRAAQPRAPVFLHPPADRFWADPFPIVRDGRTYLFLEEFVYTNRPLQQGQGHISIAEIGPEGLREGPIPVLERPYHCSYPFVFTWRGELFLLPETALRGALELYRCTRFPDAWTLEAVLMPDTRAADATLLELDGRWWMFVSLEEGDAVDFDKLYLFYADTPLGPWQPHRGNPVKSDVRAARPAGRLFREGGALYRPAQDCSKRYGYAISINRITHLNPTRFAEVEVAKIYPDWAERLLAVHTFNEWGDLSVVDCRLSHPRLF